MNPKMPRASEWDSVSEHGAALVPEPDNEPVRSYIARSDERTALVRELARQSAETLDAPLIIAGRDRAGEATFAQCAPHRHGLRLAEVQAAGPDQVQQAAEAARAAKRDWASAPFRQRAAVFLKAAELLAGPWRDRLNAATMLGQSKSVHQAEIDAACELIDFWRFNVHFAQGLAQQQPNSTSDAWNRLDYRPLEGVVLAITPFNFTAIAANLATVPALMGNTVVWKPSEKQALAAHYTMRLLQAAGMPDGVINLVHGDGAMVAERILASPDFAGLHFTGSSAVLRSLWAAIGARIDHYTTFPRIVGESGGKDFLLAHPSADVEALIVALGRGAFEYQGQKCSAASRAYVPASLWPRVRDRLAQTAGDMGVAMGDVADPSVFMGAVIDEVAFRRLVEAIGQARDAGSQVLAGGGADDTDGWFVEPTVLVTEDPQADTMQRELFGPVLTVYVYADQGRDWWDDVLRLVDTTSPYALTGSVFATDRAAIAQAGAQLRHAAGNLYINDKPTGAVVGQQPFGGARASGTNDKAGSPYSLLRWTSPRTIKESFTPARDWRYPHLD